MQLATFKGAVGINAFWPLGGFQAIYDPGLGANRPRPDVYKGTYLFCDGPPKHHFRPSVLEMVKASGIDHIRLQYEPTPILWALEHNDQAFLDGLLAYFDDCIDRILRAGLGVVLSGILVGYAGIMPLASVFAGLGSTRYGLYKQHLRIFCRRYRSRDPRYFCIEALNEPPGNGSTVVRPGGPNWAVGYTGNWATDYDPDLYAMMRAEMPLHTLFGTSDGWSNLQTLTQLVPIPAMKADLNVLWSYHPLVPTPVSLSGSTSNQYFHIARLSYPPGADGQTLAASIAAMEASVDAHPTVQTGGDPAATKAGLINDLNYYYNVPMDRAWLQWLYMQPTIWARANGIPPGNLYAGEIGFTRDNTGYPGNVLGSPLGSIANTRRTRVAAYRDSTVAAIEAGQRRAYDHLDTGDFGITSGENNTIGEFESEIIGAIQPKSRMLLRA